MDHLLVPGKNTDQPGKSETLFEVGLVVSISISFVIRNLEAGNNEAESLGHNLSLGFIAVVWVLVFVRTRILVPARGQDILCALVAIALSIVALGLQPGQRISAPAGLLVGTGALLSVSAFLALGKCFGILPAVRGVVVRGPYRLVRHPAYLGEVLIVLGFNWESSSPIHGVILMALVGALILRIKAEERLLSSDDRYRAYRKQTRYRLIPLFW